MYYRMRLTCKQALYTSEAQALCLLLKAYLHLEQQGGSLLDYTLLPTLLDLLIYVPGITPHSSFLSNRCTMEHIPTTEALLTHYKDISIKLPSAGKDYPLCGTYEAYHGSTCFCSLGKMGPFPHELSIQTILKEKSESFNRLALAR